MGFPGMLGIGTTLAPRKIRMAKSIVISPILAFLSVEQRVSPLLEPLRLQAGSACIVHSPESAHCHLDSLGTPGLWHSVRTSSGCGDNLLLHIPPAGHDGSAAALYRHRLEQQIRTAWPRPLPHSNAGLPAAQVSFDLGSLCSAFLCPLSLSFFALILPAAGILMLCRRLSSDFVISPLALIAVK